MIMSAALRPILSIIPTQRKCPCRKVPRAIIFRLILPSRVCLSMSWKIRKLRRNLLSCQLQVSVLSCHSPLYLEACLYTDLITLMIMSEPGSIYPTSVSSSCFNTILRFNCL